jgi:hypothetical protein
MISGLTVPGKGAPQSGGATTIAASRGAGRTSLPFRSGDRHDDR